MKIMSIFIFCAFIVSGCEEYFMSRLEFLHEIAIPADEHDIFVKEEENHQKFTYQETTTNMENNVDFLVCGGEKGKDIVYSLFLKKRAHLTITLKPEFNSAILDLKSTEDGSKCESNTYDESSELKIIKDLEKGEHFIIVDSNNADDHGPFTITFEIENYED